MQAHEFGPLRFVEFIRLSIARINYKRNMEYFEEAFLLQGRASQLTPGLFNLLAFRSLL